MLTDERWWAEEPQLNTIQRVLVQYSYHCIGQTLSTDTDNTNNAHQSKCIAFRILYLMSDGHLSFNKHLTVTSFQTVSPAAKLMLPAYNMFRLLTSVYCSFDLNKSFVSGRKKGSRYQSTPKGSSLPQKYVNVQKEALQQSYAKISTLRCMKQKKKPSR